MVLEGCANPHLGCCILLRGASLPELIRVKKVVKFMLLACYNWKLEKAFYADIEAILPEPGMAFDDEQDFLSDDKNGSTNDEAANADLKVGKTNDNHKENRADDGHEHGESIGGQNIDKTNDKQEENDVAFDDQEDRKTKDHQTKVIDRHKAKITNDVKNREQPKDTKANDHQIDLKSNDQQRDVNTNDDKNVVKTNDNQPIVKTNDDQPSKPNAERTDDKNEVSDPLQKPKYSRKTENLSCGVPIRDFSDPLRATSVDDEVFLKGEETLVADTQTER